MDKRLKAVAVEIANNLKENCNMSEKLKENVEEQLQPFKDKGWHIGTIKDYHGHTNRLISCGTAYVDYYAKHDPTWRIYISIGGVNTPFEFFPSPKEVLKFVDEIEMNM